MRRTTGSLLAIAVVLAAGAVAWHLTCRGSDGDRDGHGDTAAAGDAATAGRDPRASARRPAPPLPALRPRDPSIEDARRMVEEREPRGTGARMVTGALSRFEGFCEYAPAARCAEGRPLAAACAKGDGAACVKVGELLLTPPGMPHFAVLFFNAGCELDAAAACDRWEQLLDWRHGALATADGLMPAPSLAAAACTAGDPNACWFSVFTETTRQQPIDVAAAQRACDAGIADACGAIAFQAADAATAVRALEAGCAHGGLLQCKHLVAVYRGGEDCCPTPAPLDPGARDGCLPCPAPDPAAADRIEARIIALGGTP